MYAFWTSVITQETGAIPPAWLTPDWQADGWPGGQVDHGWKAECPQE